MEFKPKKEVSLLDKLKSALPFTESVRPVDLENPKVPEAERRHAWAWYSCHGRQFGFADEISGEFKGPIGRVEAPSVEEIKKLRLKLVGGNDRDLHVFGPTILLRDECEKIRQRV